MPRVMICLGNLPPGIPPKEIVLLGYWLDKGAGKHIASLKNVSSSDKYSDEQLMDLFLQDDARQVLHVTFGKVLTSIDEQGKSLFKDSLYKCLTENEDIHYSYLVNHFKNHLTPFN